MKLTKENIGQKFTNKNWKDGGYFLLLAVTSKGDLLGENESGQVSHCLDSELSNLIPYEEPKEKVLMSPCLYVSKSDLYISDQVFKLLGNAEKELKMVYTWPLKIVLKNVKTEQGFFERMEAEFYVEVEK